MKKLDKASTLSTHQLRQRGTYFFMGLAVVGAILFQQFGQSLIGGLGLSGSLYSLVAFFHFRKEREVSEKKIDTKMSMVFFGCMLLGLMVLVGNWLQDGSDFYYGIAAALTMVSGLAYGLELMTAWMENVK